MSLTEQNRARIEAATVRIESMHGQGVLVPGGFVLTAAHCIKWEGDGQMALDNLHEQVTTASGVQLMLRVAAAELCADIAALGEPDNQACAHEADAFERWRESIEAVPVSDDVLTPNESIRVYILTHDRGWITAKVTRYGIGSGQGRVFVEADSSIGGGTSGGPVVDSHGRLIGVISTATKTRR